MDEGHHLEAQLLAVSWHRAQLIKGAEHIRAAATPSWWEGEAAFESHVRRGSASLCVLDACTGNIRNYHQGSFSLVEDDIRAAFGEDDAAQSLRALRSSGVARCFDLRRELINMKKACLCLFHDAQAVVRQLIRAESYFFQDHPEPLSLCDLSAPDRAHYYSICEWLQRAKGLVRVVHDARDFTKFLCMLPRHPGEASSPTEPRDSAVAADPAADSTIHPKLQTMPASFHSAKAVANANDFLQAVSQVDGASVAAGSVHAASWADAGAIPYAGATAAAEAAAGEAAVGEVAAGKGGSESAITGGRESAITGEVLQQSLEVVLAAHERALAWPSALTRCVRCSLIARGAAKALGMAAAIECYSRALSQLQADATATHRALLALLVETSDRLEHRCALESTSEVALIRRRLLASKHACQLEAVVGATAHVLTLVRQIAQRREAHAGDAPAARGFVAGDATRGHAAMFVPPQFEQLTAQLAAATAVARELDEAMRVSMAAEGWPPPAAAGRTRVVVGGEGGFECRRCARGFSKMWTAAMDGGGARGSRSCLCWECEGELRTEGVCPYDVPLAGSGASAGRAPTHHAFCIHQRKCVCCDGASFVPCEPCRMAQGDGEMVTALAALYSPEAVFLDFDRTLCTTKSGGSPLQGVHALDGELAAQAAARPTYVVTRNRHVDEIRTFLGAKGMQVAGITHVRKGVSKAAAMLELLPSLERSPACGGIRAIFADDDVREVSDPAVAALPSLLRVLFRRGAV